MPRPIALVGLGEITRTQHLPRIAASSDWELAAACNRSHRDMDVPFYTDVDEMLQAHPQIETVSFALPPVPRFEAAMKAIRAGRNVMLEKPPGATLTEIHIMQAAAEAAGVTMFATWHSREAAGVEQAKAWLADASVERCHITWHERVGFWHPHLNWETKAGGMGVFDPGINALSVMTEILPIGVAMTKADLTFPTNWETPIAANLTFTNNVTADFDWRHEGEDIWRIEIETNKGALRMEKGGELLFIDDAPVDVGPHDEYSGLYKRMAHLVDTRTSDVDLSPMLHVSDAMTLGRRIETEAFSL